jgi:hypothetical protein
VRKGSFSLVFLGALVRFDEAHGSRTHVLVCIYVIHGVLGWVGQVGCGACRDFGKKGDYVKCIYVQPAIGRATNAQNVQDMATIGGVGRALEIMFTVVAVAILWAMA